MPSELIPSLRQDLNTFLVYDRYSRIMPANEYTVRSIYLDTLQLMTYKQKIEGIKKRNKFRIRAYNQESSDSLVFLEIKRKDVDYISKDRTQTTLHILSKLFGTNGTGNGIIAASPQGIQNFLYYYHLHNLQPKINVVYEREAFECGNGSGLRMTLDKNLRARITGSHSELFLDDEMIPCMKNRFILEIKFNRILPAWLPMILKKYDFFRRSASKYTIGIDAVYNSKFII